MAAAIRILGLSGSLRSGSHNTALLRAAAMSLPSGAELEVYDGLRDLPAYDADLDTPETEPESVARLREAIAQADGVLIATPEFNGSIPGALKNALDWASRPFPDNAMRGKPVAVVGASTGLFGAVWAQAETRKVLGIIGADVLDGELPVGSMWFPPSSFRCPPTPPAFRRSASAPTHGATASASSARPHG
jgi:chromate reductase